MFPGNQRPNVPEGSRKRKKNLFSERAWQVLAMLLLLAVMNASGQGPVTTTSGYGPTTLPSGSPNSLQLGGGGSNPNADSVTFGDGTGWLLNFGPVTGGTFRPKITMSDKGVFGTVGGYGTEFIDSAGAVQIGAGGSSPNAGSVAFGDGTGWLLNYGPMVSGTFSPRITMTDLGVIATKAGYGTAAMVNADAIQIGGGGPSPNAGSIIFGDGTGWQINLGPIRSGSFTPQFTFVDTGSLGVGTTSPAFALDVNGSMHSSGHLKVDGGVSASGGGLKHIRVQGCTVAANANFCSQTVQWPTAFPDSNYTTTCVSQSGGSISFSNKASSTITIGVNFAFFAQSSSPTGELDCIAMHD